ncbi:MAG TPA: serine hydrolase [Pyrinomonadaceae bacterium]|nr:serine hydrolase [Pyrinomonadaceae bacterium]
MNNPISDFLKQHIEQKDFPSTIYLIAENGEIVLQDALGFAVVEPEKIEANLDTIYDLASLTKPLVTGLLCAKLIETGEIKLEDKIARYFPEFETEEKREMTIENLLVHTSGFRDWFPFYLFSNGEEYEEKRESIIRQVAAQPLENPVNSKVNYSDYNFLLLGFLLEKIYGERLDKIARENLFQPLNLQNTFFNPPQKILRQIAASESGNFYEKETCNTLGFYKSFYDSRDYQLSETEEKEVINHLWRQHPIWGEVHDGNCYFLGGVSGHAGLFSTVEETFKIARQFLPETTQILKPETCSLFRINFTGGLNKSRSIGFQLAENEDSTAHGILTNDSYGHLGFTGTSVWIEPETERVFILLTNRTHDRELPFAAMKPIRQRFHEIAVECLNR